MNAHCRIGEHGSEQLRVQLRNDRIQILVDLDGYMELRPVRLGALYVSCLLVDWPNALKAFTV